MDVENIVSILITKQSKAVTQAGFGTILVLGPNGAFLSKLRTYTNLTGVAVDYLLTDPEYRAANAIFAQTIKVDKIKIAKEGAKVAQVTVLEFDINFVALNEITYSINGVDFGPIVFNADQATTLAALAASIQAHPLIATAQVTDTREITITAQTAGIPFILSDVLVEEGATQPVATITTQTPNHGLVDDLIEVIHADDDWYGLILTSRDPAEVEMVADFIETQRKLFITCTDDADVLDPDITTDIASVLNLKTYQRTAVLYNGLPDDFADAAWMGRCFPIDPGGVNFAHKELASITPDNLTQTEIDGALGKNANVYVPSGGQSVTWYGTAASGQYLDIVRDTDWLEARLKESLLSKFVNTEKIPYTDEGVTILHGGVHEVLQSAEDVNVLAKDPKFTIGVIPVAQISFNDRANRFYPGLSFEAFYANAINKAKVTGNISL